MKSFGRLLRRLRGKTAPTEIAPRMGLPVDELAQIEAGKVRVEPAVARRLLRRGFGLARPDVERLILGVELYDLGLKNNELRQLVIAAVRQELPAPLQAELQVLAHRAAQA